MHLVYLPNLHPILLISGYFLSFRSRYQHKGKSPYICESHWDGCLHGHRAWQESHQGAAAVTVDYENHVFGQWFSDYYFVVFFNLFIQARHMESVGLDLAALISKNCSSHASSILRPLWVLYRTDNPNKISLTSKGIVMRDNTAVGRSLSCPNLTRSSRSKYNYSKCSVSRDSL